MNANFRCDKFSYMYPNTPTAKENQLFCEFFQVVEYSLTIEVYFVKYSQMRPAFKHVDECKNFTLDSFMYNFGAKFAITVIFWLHRSG